MITAIDLCNDFLFGVRLNNWNVQQYDEVLEEPLREYLKSGVLDYLEQKRAIGRLQETLTHQKYDEIRQTAYGIWQRRGEPKDQESERKIWREAEELVIKKYFRVEIGTVQSQQLSIL
jgi:hypothetical protein